MFRVSGKNKKNNFRNVFFFFFPENFSRRVHKSTNKKILANHTIGLVKQNV